MKIVRFCMGVLAVCSFAGMVWAGKAGEEPQLRLELDLVDGSRVIGAPSVSVVPLRTSYARVDIPLKQILTISAHSDHETVSVDLQNGDKLKGVINLATINLDTLFGNVSIGIEQIRTLRVAGVSRGLPEALTKGLVLHYSFDRDEGEKVSDESGRCNDGVVKGVQWTQKGKTGAAYEFDGRQSCIEVKDASSLTPKDQLALSAWVLIKDYGQTFPAIMSKGNIGNYRESYGLFVSAEGKPEFLINLNGRASGRGELYGPKIALNEWTHIAATFDGREMKLYVNGTRAGSLEKVISDGGALISSRSSRMSDGMSKLREGMAHHGIFVTSDPLLIGKADRQGTSYQSTCFNGMIDEVLIYERALSESEVRRIYDAQR